MTDMASITKTPPITANKSSWLMQIATTPTAPPKANDPVSPINTFAG